MCPEVTVISCGNDGRGVHFHSGEGPESVMQGLTIRYGRFYGHDNGGGVLIQNSSPTIANCIILGNRVFSDDGGGIYAYRSSSIVANCIITGNVCARFGGGICSSQSSLSVINCTIVYNQSTGQWWNDDWGSGGGIYCDSIFVKNSIIKGNKYYYGANGVVCTKFAFITYSNVQGNWPGVGNINVDPLFRDRDNDDFHLQATYCDDPNDSPCIDGGDPNVLDAVLDCQHGLGSERSDMGAYGGNNFGWPTYVELGDEESVSLPERFFLLQNYPNPFNSQTLLNYSLMQHAWVTLSVYNVLGQREVILFEGFLNAGEYSTIWGASVFPSGIYLAKLEVGGYSKTIKMVLIK
jgi:parallel beta-helix repeat protein